VGSRDGGIKPGMLQSPLSSAEGRWLSLSGMAVRIVLLLVSPFTRSSPISCRRRLWALRGISHGPVGLSPSGAHGWPRAEDGPPHPGSSRSEVCRSSGCPPLRAASCAPYSRKTPQMIPLHDRKTATCRWIGRLAVARVTVVAWFLPSRGRLLMSATGASFLRRYWWSSVAAMDR